MLWWFRQPTKKINSKPILFTQYTPRGIRCSVQPPAGKPSIVILQWYEKRTGIYLPLSFTAGNLILLQVVQRSVSLSILANGASLACPIECTSRLKRGLIPKHTKYCRGYFLVLLGNTSLELPKRVKQGAIWSADNWFNSCIWYMILSSHGGGSRRVFTKTHMWYQVVHKYKVSINNRVIISPTISRRLTITGEHSTYCRIKHC